jgi:hypothetical protein
MVSMTTDLLAVFIASDVTRRTIDGAGPNRPRTRTQKRAGLTPRGTS